MATEQDEHREALVLQADQELIGIVISMMITRRPLISPENERPTLP
ncbi:MAG TPA: hypothetical protein VFL82_05730 [Thermomicrobiales bacterium]|nr:hypothetical protein [Thermomicrobiales bacterium]